MLDRFARIAAVLAAPSLIACAGGGTSMETVPTPAATPRPFAYAAGTSQYRFTANGTHTQTMMGQSQDMTSSASRLVTITLARVSPDTMSLTVVLDSMTMSGGMGMPTPNVNELIGKSFGARIAPDGLVHSITGPAEPPMAAAMAEDLGRMLPRIKGILAPGAQWTDTVTDSPRQSGLELKRQAVTRYAVVGDSVVGGETAWKISRNTEVLMSGAGATQGTNIVFESTGTATGILLIGRDGSLVGSHTEEKMNGKATVAANGMEIGIMNATTTTVVKVR